jgi:ribonucleoside-triphosphate reductase
MSEEINYGELFQPDRQVFVIKKDGSKELFNVQKVIVAVGKSAYRALTKFTDEEKVHICTDVVNKVNEMDTDEIPIPIMHNIVESALEDVKPIVAKSYRDYRNYKQDFVRMMDDVYKKSQSIMYVGDKENANTDSALVSTKRSLIFNQFNKELYQKFFMTTEEIQACRDGYIYVHDMSARRDTMNCCLFDVQSVLTGGFEMGNIWYNEPKSLDVAFDVIGDIVLSAASQQYGGFTVPEVDKILAPYAEKTYKHSYEKYTSLGIDDEKAKEVALADVQREFEQGFQGWEYKFNTVASSRGDYPFITMTAGLGTERFAKMATIEMLNVRRKGQGKKECKKPVLFPKIVFLYDENLHGPGKPLEDVFEAGVRCSAKTMYPDWLSLTGKGYIASMYKQYGKVISPMGCRAFLSPWYERGGMHPADENDVPVFVGRFNIGAVSLHLPMILAKSRRESKDFYKVLDYYLNLIRQLHIRTYEYLGNMRASTNPLAYC